MDLLILNGVYAYNNNLAYRGTERRMPTYHQELGPDHEANRAFQWFLEEGGERGETLGVVHDLVKAQALVAAYGRLTPPERFEIIEVTTGNRTPMANGKFLGFDLSYGFRNSLLAAGSDDTTEREVQISADADMAIILQPILRLIDAFFAPHLNTHKLFSNYEDASFCLDCLMAVQKIRPGFLEYGDYEVTGMWSMP